MMHAQPNRPPPPVDTSIQAIWLRMLNNMEWILSLRIVLSCNIDQHKRTMQEDLAYYGANYYDEEDPKFNYNMEEINAMGMPDPDQKNFGLITFARIIAEFRYNIEKMETPWSLIDEDVVANIRTGISMYDDNLVDWKVVVSKIIKHITRIIYGDQSQITCNRIVHFFQVLADVAAEELTLAQPRVTRAASEETLQRLIKSFEAERTSLITSLDNLVESYVTNINWEEVNLPKALQQMPREIKGEITPEILMWVRATTTYVLQTIMRKLGGNIELIFFTFFKNLLFEKARRPFN